MNTEEILALITVPRKVTIEPVGFFGTNVKRFELSQSAAGGDRASLGGFGEFCQALTPLGYTAESPILSIAGYKYPWMVEAHIARGIEQLKQIATFSIEQELMRQYEKRCGKRYVLHNQELNWNSLDGFYDYQKVRIGKDDESALAGRDAAGFPFIKMIGEYDAFDGLKADGASRKSLAGKRSCYSGWVFDTIQYGRRFKDYNPASEVHPYEYIGADLELSLDYAEAPVAEAYVWIPTVMEVTDSLFEWDMVWVPKKDENGEPTTEGVWRYSVQYTPRTVRGDLGAAIRYGRCSRVSAEEAAGGCGLVMPTDKPDGGIEMVDEVLGKATEEAQGVWGGELPTPCPTFRAEVRPEAIPSEVIKDAADFTKAECGRIAKEQSMVHRIEFRTDSYAIAATLLGTIKKEAAGIKKKHTQCPLPNYHVEHNIEPKLDGVEDAKAELLRQIGEHNTGSALCLAKAPVLQGSVDICLWDIEFASQVRRTLMHVRMGERAPATCIINPVFYPIDKDTDPDESKVKLELYY